MADEWRPAAACQTQDPRVFFGGDDETPAERRKREARAVLVCAGCAVRQACGDFAIEHRVADGVWGGMTEETRERLIGPATKRR